MTKSPPPDPQKITPDNGPEMGGTQVQITGQHLGLSAEDLVLVNITSAACLDTRWISQQAINCTTGAYADAGKGSVVVVTRSGGESHHELKFTYNYAPLITDVAPASGPIAGGTLVNVTGRNFGDSKEELVDVRLAGVSCRSVNWVNGKTILCISETQPDGKSVDGFVEVVTTNGGIGKSNRTQDDVPLTWSYNPSSP